MKGLDENLPYVFGASMGHQSSTLFTMILYQVHQDKDQEYHEPRPIWRYDSSYKWLWGTGLGYVKHLSVLSNIFVLLRKKHFDGNFTREIYQSQIFLTNFQLKSSFYQLKKSKKTSHFFFEKYTKKCFLVLPDFILIK